MDPFLILIRTQIDQILEDLSVAERIMFLEYLAARYVLGSFKDMPLNVADRTGAVHAAEREDNHGITYTQCSCVVLLDPVYAVH
jgi:hypothetical protein